MKPFEAEEAFTDVIGHLLDQELSISWSSTYEGRSYIV